MRWTSPTDLRKQVQKLWDKGVLLRELIGQESEFPLRLKLKKPSSNELVDSFPDIRDWITELRSNEGQYRIVWRTLNHRVLGENDLPDQLWIDTLDDALAFIGKKTQAQRFSGLLEETEQQHTALISWLKKRPLNALDLHQEWDSILRIVSWMQEHPRPDIYLRQVDIPGVHSKVIESRKQVLSELFDLALEHDAINTNATGARGFCKRYGFKDKPIGVRFRILSPEQSIFPGKGDQDISIPHDTFADLNLDVDSIFITENEINFLAFPALPRSMVIFGSGYGFESLGTADWLQSKKLFYWGDIDTHGFSILNQFRSSFPSTRSFLMDHNTFQYHKEFWGDEQKQETRNLPRLTPEETKLYEELRIGTYGDNLRLEQERIRFGWLSATLIRQKKSISRDLNESKILENPDQFHYRST